MNALRDIQKQISSGESEIIELKRSTGQLNPAGKTLCAFLNGQGGKVVIGAGDTGKLVGQVVSDKTRRELAMMLDRFEPPALVDVEYVDIPGGSKQIIVLSAKAQDEAKPFTFDGRAYQRVQSTTSVMPQDRYEQILLERAHARRRWENQQPVPWDQDHGRHLGQSPGASACFRHHARGHGLAGQDLAARRTFS